MSEVSVSDAAVSQTLLDSRLDAVDRALLGLIPRKERMTIVADLERRVREITASDPTYQIEPLAIASSELVANSTATVSRDSCEHKAKTTRRSRLALAAGILGIVSLVLLFTTPITYVVISLCEDLLQETTGEIFAATILIGQALGTTLGGILAVVFGIAGAVIVSQRHRQLTGAGWAVTGLCTGMLPMLIGGLLCLVVGIPSAMVMYQGVGSATVVPTANNQIYASPASASMELTCTPSSPYGVTPSPLPQPPIPAGPALYSQPAGKLPMPVANCPSSKCPPPISIPQYPTVPAASGMVPLIPPSAAPPAPMYSPGTAPQALPTNPYTAAPSPPAPMATKPASGGPVSAEPTITVPAPISTPPAIPAVPKPDFAN